MKNREAVKQAIKRYLTTLDIIPQSELETIAEDITYIVEQHGFIKDDS